MYVLIERDLVINLDRVVAVLGGDARCGGGNARTRPGNTNDSRGAALLLVDGTMVWSRLGKAAVARRLASGQLDETGVRNGGK